ncbi:MAG: peptidoglycan DD-metalloendopeptidase family protein [Arcobacteraceae bacterium]|nr:peptidoglycan DD-metalloendopeptidase family protein [Arcobacteraceae bacterium]
MFKLLLSFVLLFSFIEASVKDIERKINSNKKEFKDIASEKKDINSNIESLAKRINAEEEAYKKVVSVLDSTNTQLVLNKMKLSSAKSKVDKLKIESDKLIKIREKIEKDVVDFVIERYAMSMGIEQANKESLKDVIGKEVYTLVFDNNKQEMLDININYLKINNQIRDNERKIDELNKYLEEQKSVKERYKDLEATYEKKLESLKKQHSIYQQNLRKVIEKQNKVTDLLGSLNILKKEEIKKEEIRIRKAKALAKRKEAARQKAEEAKRKAEAARLAKLNKNTNKKDEEIPEDQTKQMKFEKKKELDKDIDVEVRKIGSSAKGIKISKYNGRKTMAPLKSYDVVKKFGKYYDDVYKMELFNESVSLKTKIPNGKVFSVFKGRIVYAKENSGLLAKVVIVKHSNGLHTIYSHLDKISPTLKVGKWIPKGYVVGRVSDTLEFQATKDSKYIDPMRLIK